MAQTIVPEEILVCTSVSFRFCKLEDLTAYSGQNFKVIQNLNQWFQAGDTSFVLISAFLVLLMPPGLGLIYSGLSQRRSGLSIILAIVGSFSVITLQWLLWGYSLAFTRTGKSGFIGNLEHIGLRKTLAVPSAGSPLVSELLYSFFQVSRCLIFLHAS
jgi:Amt family ammonium transporter